MIKKYYTKLIKAVPKSTDNEKPMTKAYFPVGQHGNNFIFIKMEKAKTHKYIKRINHPSGKGYLYFYNQKQLKDYKEKGILPEKKSGGLLQGIMNFFGIKDEKKAQEKVKSEYESHRKELTGVSIDSFTDHLNEYLSNKDKWDKRLSGEKKTSQSVSGEKKTVTRDKKTGAVKSVSGKKFNLSVMRVVAGIYGGGKELEEISSPKQIKEAKNKAKEIAKEMFLNEDREQYQPGDNKKLQSAIEELNNLYGKETRGVMLQAYAKELNSLNGKLYREGESFRDNLKKQSDNKDNFDTMPKEMPDTIIKKGDMEFTRKDGMWVMKNVSPDYKGPWKGGARVTDPIKIKELNEEAKSKSEPDKSPVMSQSQKNAQAALGIKESDSEEIKKLKIEKSKLQTRAFKQIPGSINQKKTLAEIEKINKKIKSQSDKSPLMLENMDLNKKNILGNDNDYDKLQSLKNKIENDFNKKYSTDQKGSIKIENNNVVYIPNKEILDKERISGEDVGKMSFKTSSEDIKSKESKKTDKQKGRELQKKLDQKEKNYFSYNTKRTNAHNFQELKNIKNFALENNIKFPSNLQKELTDLAKIMSGISGTQSDKSSVMKEGSLNNKEILWNKPRTEKGNKVIYADSPTINYPYANIIIIQREKGNVVAYSRQKSFDSSTEKFIGRFTTVKEAKKNIQLLYDKQNKLQKATDLLLSELEKAKKMPIGTVSKGRKKIAEGKWVPVTEGKDKNQNTKQGTKSDKKPDKKTPESVGKKAIFRDTLKKVANILAEALKGQNASQPAGAAIEQTGENIQANREKKKQQAKKEKK